MMGPSKLAPLASAVINSLQPDTFDEDGLEKLRFLFPDNLILAALDLIDRESVIKYMTPWDRVQYEVLGSTATYTVFPELPSSDGRSSLYCSCPAFAYSALLSGSQIMCKHVLATLIAQRLSKCIERAIRESDLAALVTRQCSV